MKRLVISIDGGGSKAKALLYDVDLLRPLRYLETESINHHNVGFDKAISNLNELILKLSDKNHAKYYILGLAGLDSKYDYELWERYIKKRFPNSILIHDVKMALYAATYSNTGIIVISGTGVNVYGCNGNDEWYSGNWGWKIGDEGSGYYVGREALRYVFRYLDGRGKKTILYDKILEYLGLNDKDMLIRWAYEANVPGISRLSHVVCNSYYDEISRKIIHDAVDSLLESINAVVRRLTNEYPINYTGGMFRCKPYHERFVKRLGEEGLNEGRYIEHPVAGGIIHFLKKEAIKEDLDDIYDQINDFIDHAKDDHS